MKRHVIHVDSSKDTIIELHIRSGNGMEQPTSPHNAVVNKLTNRRVLTIDPKSNYAKILYALEKYGPQNASALVNRTGISYNTVTSFVNPRKHKNSSRDKKWRQILSKTGIGKNVKYRINGNYETTSSST